MMEHRTLKAFEEKLRSTIDSYSEGEGTLEDVLYMAEKVISYKHNRGFYSERLKHNKREQAFHDQWQQENAPVSGVNHGHGILQDLFIKETSVLHSQEVVEVISKRDRMIVATVIQWLGSNCGMCFLGESLKRFGAKIVYVTLFFMLLGCEYLEPVVGIDPQIKPFVDSFFREAELRDLHGLRPATLNAGFKDMRSGQGRANQFTNTIIIDPNSMGWKYNPEALVFHELGHLVLKRGHVNKRVGKFCVSIMSNADDPIYDMHPDERLYNRRQYYVDELFNPDMEVPEWMATTNK